MNFGKSAFWKKIKNTWTGVCWSRCRGQNTGPVPDPHSQAQNAARAAGNRFVLIYEDGRAESFPQIEGLKVSFLSEGGVVEIEAPCAFKETKIVCGKNAQVRIGTNFRVGGKLFVEARADNCRVQIGKNVWVGGAYLGLFDAEGRTISIGDGCLLSYGIDMRASDGHTIIDQETGRPLNPDGDITLQERVWLGHSVTVLKDTFIAHDCIAGKGALLNKHYNEPHCIVAGCPAKVIKRGVSWSNLPYSQYVKQYQAGADH